MERHVTVYESLDGKLFVIEDASAKGPRPTISKGGESMGCCSRPNQTKNGTEDIALVREQAREKLQHLAGQANAFGFLARLYLLEKDGRREDLEQLIDFDYEELCFVLPQICHYIVHSSIREEDIERCLLDACSRHRELALTLFWTLREQIIKASQSMEGDCRPEVARDRCIRLLLGIEAAVNRNTETRAVNVEDVVLQTSANGPKESDSDRLRVSTSSMMDAASGGHKRRSRTIGNLQDIIQVATGEERQAASRSGVESDSSAGHKLERMLEKPDGIPGSAFHAEVVLINALTDASVYLLEFPPDERKKKLEGRLEKINAYLSAHPTMLPMSNGHERAIRIPPEECYVFRTNTRAPYVIYIESLPTELGLDLIKEKQSGRRLTLRERMKHSLHSLGPLSGRKSGRKQSARSKSDSRQKKQTASDEHELLTTEIGPAPTQSSAEPIIAEHMMSPNRRQTDSDGQDSDVEPGSPAMEFQPPENLYEVYGEPFRARKDRLQRNSPAGTEEHWALHSCLVKTRDDLRQEALAMQLIRLIRGCFRKDHLKLWLYPYSILPTSCDAGLVETIPDAMSLDSLKRKTLGYTTLLNYFREHYGVERSPAFQRARKNFVRSMAGYSLVCYILQIKDRHNGNIMLDSLGHIMHIDFGFLLTNSPGGNAGFEKAPFKLTREMVEVMGGIGSKGFRDFVRLLQKGFISIRKRASELELLVRMLLPYSPFPCFVGGEHAVKGLEERLHLTLSESEIHHMVRGLVDSSLDNWRTKFYDKYQRCCVGIR